MVADHLVGRAEELDVRTLHLETDRLELRVLTLDDLNDVATMLGDAEALRLWGGPMDRDEARRWIERNLARYEADGFGRCAVILRATGAFVGDVGLITTTVEGQAEVELGWIVCRPYGETVSRLKPPPRGGTSPSTRSGWSASVHDQRGEHGIQAGSGEARNDGRARGGVGRPPALDVLAPAGLASKHA